MLENKTTDTIVCLCAYRYSVPFFLEPKYSANMSVRLPGVLEVPPEPVSYGPWALTKMINDYYEFSDLPYPQSLVA